MSVRIKYKAVIAIGTCCTFFHRWTLVRDTGITKYYSCKDCTARKVVQINNVYQPINENWLRWKGPLE